MVTVWAGGAEGANVAYTLTASWDALDQEWIWVPSPQMQMDYGDRLVVTLQCDDVLAEHPFRLLDDGGGQVGEMSDPICGEVNEDEVVWVADAESLLEHEDYVDYSYECFNHPDTMSGGLTINIPADPGGGEGGGGYNNDAPIAAFTFTPADPVVGEEITFDGTISTDDDAVAGWSWNFGDGTPGSSLGKPVHTYAAAGTYQVTLTVTDGAGATNAVTHSVIVAEAPNVAPIAAFNFSPADAQPGDDVTFTDSSEDLDGTLAAWSWDFGDGLASTDRNPVHAFGSAGSFTVALTVRDDEGATGTVSHVVSIANDLPTARFTFSPTSPAKGEEVAFDATGSSDPDGSLVSFAWDFGDGTTGDAKIATHAFNEGGSFAVTLTVRDNGRGEATSTQVVTVAGGSGPAATTGGAPVAAIGVSPLEPIAGAIVHFTDLSTDDGSIVARSWALGDGTLSLDRNPVHLYDEPGTYEVTLLVTDDDGLTARARVTVRVLAAAGDAAQSASSSTGAGADEGLSANTADGGATGAGTSDGSLPATDTVGTVADERDWTAIGVFAGFLAVGALAGVAVSRFT